MKNITGNRATKWMRWIARGIGSLAGAYWFLALVGHLIWGDDTQVFLEGAMLAGLVITTVLGVLIAWWRERIGGTIVITGAIALGAFAYITAGHNKAFAMLVVGVPFLVPGILFLASWRRSRRLRISQNSA